MISVVIPTIGGREELLERTVAAYKATTPDLELIVVRNQPTCGEGWNLGAEKATSKWLHLSADDVLPHEGWYEVADERAKTYPAPRILNEDGSVLACGSMGGGMLLPDARDGAHCLVSQFPLLTLADWKLVGPCLPIHYYGDDYLAHRARRAGLRVRYRESYCLTHLEGTAGRPAVVERAMADCQTYLQAVAQ